MEYLEYHGIYEDIPVDAIVRAWERAYGGDRVRQWIAMFKKQDESAFGDFHSEEVWQG